MWTESSSLNCKLCKFGKYICYNFRDIKFFLWGYFFGGRPVELCDCHIVKYDPFSRLDTEPDRDRRMDEEY